MGIANYTELTAHIENWLDHTRFTSLLDEFIYLTEDRLNKELRVKEMITRSTAPTSTSSRYLVHPTDYLEMKRLRLLTSPYKELMQISPENITKFDSTSPQEPQFYCDVDEQIEFDSTPDAVYTVEMVFYEKIADLTASNTTNVILTAYPNLYLFGALVEAFMYGLEDERAAYFEGRFVKELNMANNEQEKRARHSVPLSVNTDMPNVKNIRSRSIIRL